jgi:hypothetical protein
MPSFLVSPAAAHRDRSLHSVGFPQGGDHMRPPRGPGGEFVFFV